MTAENETGRSSERLAYSVEEAGRMIGISKRMLYELIRTGELRSVKIRTRRLVRHVDLERYLASLDEAA